MIWKFDNSHTYLLGSIHALHAGRNSHSKQIDEIYSQSTHIVFEANLENIPLSLLTYSGEDKLSDNISHNLFTKTQKKWAKYGFPTAELEKTKPWQVANKLTMKLLEKRGFSFEHSIDKQLLLRAKSDSKSIIFLEPANAALLCFDNAPMDEQTEYLSTIINNPDAIIDRFNKILKAWSIADINLLSAILQESFKSLPVLFQCLITNRNKAWLRTILTSIETGTSALIAVGALHCLDVCSIQSLIRDIHGYTSTALK